MKKISSRSFDRILKRSSPLITKKIKNMLDEIDSNYQKNIIKPEKEKTLNS